MSGQNVFTSFQGVALQEVNKREQAAALMKAINSHADAIDHLNKGLEKMFYELQKRDFQIEALLDGNANLTKRIEALEQATSVTHG